MHIHNLHFRKTGNQTISVLLVNFQSMLVMIVFHGYFFVDIQTKWKVGRYDKISVFIESKSQQIGLNKLATWLRSNRLKRNVQSNPITYQNLYNMLKRYVNLYNDSESLMWVKSG